MFGTILLARGQYRGSQTKLELFATLHQSRPLWDGFFACAISYPLARFAPTRDTNKLRTSSLDNQMTSSYFTDVPTAIAEVRAGRMVVVVDDEDRENEGDLTL